tara:strand:- start:297 stop:536 length:240 start_codon:yes stop_codon:yes gene_type:complete
MSTENFNEKRYETVVSPQFIGDYIDIRLNNVSKEQNDSGYWKLYNPTDPKEDYDQLKAITGICFMFMTLLITGLYSFLT